MPVSSLFEKLKLRRGSNPPSPSSSLKESGHARGDSRTSVEVPGARGSHDQGRVGSIDAARVPVTPTGTTFNGQTPVGAGNHVVGKTDIAENVNAVLEHQPIRQSQPSASSAVPAGVAAPSNLPSSHDHAGLSANQASRVPSNVSSRHHARSESITKTLPPVPVVPASVATNRAGQFDSDGFPISARSSVSTPQKVSSSDHHHASADQHGEKTIPRSPATFTLPTVPQTPALSEQVEQGLLSRQHQQQQQHQQTSIPRDAETMGYSLSEPTPVQSSTKQAQWTESSMNPILATHDLSEPSSILPYPVPDQQSLATDSRAFIKSQSTTSNSPTSVSHGLKPNPAYIASREYSFSPSPVNATEPSKQHLDYHLSLLQGQLFNPASLRGGFAKPGKIIPMKPSPAGSTTQRDQALESQREGLLVEIARGEQEAEATGLRGVKAKHGLSEKAVGAFRQAGWAERIGVLDTVDVRTRMLEPIIQEHIVPFETEVFETMIFRDIHKYHIYPYIQPIEDPNPTILPTRHLFKDAQGNYREIIGDSAAEAILGHSLSRLSGEDKIYTERWIESVSGTEYETIERESVRVGHESYLSSFGKGVTTQTARTAPGSFLEGGNKKPRTFSSSTSAGRPVGLSSPRSPRDAPAPPSPSNYGNRQGGQMEDVQMGRAF